MMGNDDVNGNGVESFNANWATAWENQQNDMCAQRRLSPHEERLGP